MSDPNFILTNKEKNLCEYSAIAGVLLSLTCLIQHFIVVIPRPITNLMVPFYFFSIISFLLLGLQKAVSPVLLIISGALSAIIVWLWMTHYSFSLVVILLFLYHAIIVVVLFIEGVPRKLTIKKAAEKAERDIWAGKI